jgi:hypothetical protein
MTQKESWLEVEWRHHDLSTPALTAVSLYALEAAASLVLHDGQVDGIAAIGALATASVVWTRSCAFWMAVYLTAATLVTLAWILYAEHASPFTARALTFAAGAAVGLGVLYQGAVRAERAERQETDRRLAARAEAGEWPSVFAALGIPGVELVEESEFRAGRTATLRLPAHGRATFTRVAALAERLETVLDLPGGSVKFRQGETARGFHVDIHTRDVLAEDLPFEFETSPTSISEPFDIGRDVFGEDIMVLIREIRAAIFAPPGSGKSNLLNVLIARLLRCVDVVIWAIDFKGGRMIKPWLQPWFEGVTDRPVIDWVATTPREAQLLLQGLKDVIEHRSGRGVGEKITPSARQPAIILISDEGSSVVGLDAVAGRALATLVKDIIALGRSEAVDAILCFLRASVPMTGTSDLKALSKLRITLGATSAADATAATDNPGMGGEVTAFEHPGTMLVQKGRKNVRIGKSLRMEDPDVPYVARIYSDRRPALEPDAEQALGAVYAERWSLARCGHLLPFERQQELGFDPKTAAAAVAQEAAAHPAAPAAPLTLPTIPPPPANARPAYKTVQGEPIPRALDDQAVEDLFAGLRGQVDEALSSVRIGPERMLALVRAAGREGISPKSLTEQLNAEDIGVGRQAVHDWLTEAIKDGLIIRRLRGEYVAAEYA